MAFVGMERRRNQSLTIPIVGSVEKVCINQICCILYAHTKTDLFRGLTSQLPCEVPVSPFPQLLETRGGKQRASVSAGPVSDPIESKKQLWLNSVN